MKKNLGKFFVMISVFLSVELYALDYKWSLNEYSKRVYINEAIYLKYVCKFKDKASLYGVEFKEATDTPEYRLEVLRENEKIIDGKKINEFEFVLFIKKPGPFKLELSARMKETNKDSIENTVLGRDNIDYEEFSLKIIKHKAITIDVKNSMSDVVGKLELITNKDAQNIKAYEPYHLEFILNGNADFSEIPEILYKIDGVKVFARDTKVDVSLSKSGYEGRWSKKFAFVAEKDFTVPSFDLEYFDLEAKSLKTLHMDSIDVKVEKALYKKEELLDEKKNSFEFKVDYLYYILVFILGFLVGKIKFKKNVTSLSSRDIFASKVQNMKSFKELNFFLVLEDATKYNEIISKIDSGEFSSLDKAKKEVLQRF